MRCAAHTQRKKNLTRYGILFYEYFYWREHPNCDSLSPKNVLPCTLGRREWETWKWDFRGKTENWFSVSEWNRIVFHKAKWSRRTFFINCSCFIASSFLVYFQGWNHDHGKEYNRFLRAYYSRVCGGLSYKLNFPPIGYGRPFSPKCHPAALEYTNAKVLFITTSHATTIHISAACGLHWAPYHFRVHDTVIHERFIFNFE